VTEEGRVVLFSSEEDEETALLCPETKKQFKKTGYRLLKGLGREVKLTYYNKHGYSDV
jgi:hypothetical protein